MEEQNIYACRDSGAGGQGAGARGREPLSLVLTFSARGCWWCKGPWGQGVAPPSEGLVVVAVGRPVPEHLAHVAVGPLLAPAAVVGRVRRLLQRLRLRRAVLGVVQVEAATDVAEETGLLLGQALLLTARAATAQVSASVTQEQGPRPCTVSSWLLRLRKCHRAQQKIGYKPLLHHPAVPPQSPAL